MHPFWCGSFVVCMIHFVQHDISKSNWRKTPGETSRMFLVGVMKYYFGSFLDNRKRWRGLSIFTHICIEKSQSLSIAVSPLKGTACVCTHARTYTHTLSKMKIVKFRSGMLSSSTYSSEAPNCIV